MRLTAVNYTRDSKMLTALHSQLKDEAAWPQNSHLLTGREAIRDIRKGALALGVFSDTDDLVALCSYSIEDSVLRIFNLIGRGGAKFIIETLKEIADDRRLTITLNSGSDDSNAWYEKHGLTQVDTSCMYIYNPV